MTNFRSVTALPAAQWAVLWIVLATTLLLAPLRGLEAHSPAFQSAAEKFAWLCENGRSSNPSTRPTVVTAAEWNAYLNQGGVKLPEGISGVRISCKAEMVDGVAEIDFDRLTANRTRGNPLLALFTGTHQVEVTAQASAVHGTGTVHVDSVWFDGVEIPRLALEYFASRYLRPKYGNAIGMDSTFALRKRVDAVVLGDDQVTITQR